MGMRHRNWVIKVVSKIGTIELHEKNFTQNAHFDLNLNHCDRGGNTRFYTFDVIITNRQTDERATIAKDRQILPVGCVSVVLFFSLMSDVKCDVGTDNFMRTTSRARQNFQKMTKMQKKKQKTLLKSISYYEKNGGKIFTDGPTDR